MRAITNISAIKPVNTLGAIPARAGGGGVAWDVSTASYDSKSFYIGSEIIVPYAVAFASDGTRMYMLGRNVKSVHQYTLSTAWDVSTASYDSKSFSFESQISAPVAVAFAPDGTRMYAAGKGLVCQYTLSAAWDVSTASYDSKYINPNDVSTYAVAFAPDGTRMYMLGQNVKSVRQYTLSTAWDVSTASYDSKYINPNDVSTYGLALSSDGTRMYMLGQKVKSVHQYTLSTAWDVSTASYDSKSFSFESQETVPLDVAFDPDGTRMYAVGNDADTVFQYSLGA